MVEESTAARATQRPEARFYFALVAAFETGSQRNVQAAFSSAACCSAVTEGISCPRLVRIAFASSFSGNAALNG